MAFYAPPGHSESTLDNGQTLNKFTGASQEKCKLEGSTPSNRMPRSAILGSETAFNRLMDPALGAVQISNGH
jgi:hypothetical protein